MIKGPLYKIDSKGKVRTYEIEIEGNKYRVITGLKEGAKVTSKWTVCVGKNLEKSNETTPEQQAVLEANAKFEKKLKEHYHLTEEEAQETPSKYFQVMLADEWSKVKNIGEWKSLHKYLLLDPKLDGMRLVCKATEYHSRKGKHVEPAKFIYERLESFFKKHPSIILDGELYNHDYGDDFNGLMKLSRRQTMDLIQAKAAQDILEYHIYDMFDLNNPSMTAEERKAWLITEFTRGDLKGLKNIVKVETYPVYDEELFEKLKEKMITDGYEGSIVRIPTAQYKNGRSKDLIKIKEFITEEFPIVSIESGKGNKSKMAGTVNVNVNGVVVGCGIRGSHEYCKAMLSDQLDLIGEEATVRHFGLTPDGSLRFPVCIDIKRWDYE